MKMQVIDQKGVKKSEIDFPEIIASQKYNFDLVHQLVTAYTHNSHANTKAQKNRQPSEGEEENPGDRREQEGLEQEQ